MTQPAPVRRTRSIKFKLLSISVGMTSLAILVIAIIAIGSAQRISQQAKQISSQSLRDQAQEYLVKLTETKARENDLILTQVENDVQKIAASAAAIFDSSDSLANSSFWPIDKHLAAGTSGQYANSPQDTTSVFVPNFQKIDAAIQKDVELSAYLDWVLPAVFKNNPNSEAIYFATPRDVVRYYPNIDLGSVLPPDFRATERVWFTGSSPEKDPKQAAWWTPVYQDATGLGLVTTAAMPVYNQKQELLGVVGFDISLDEMKSRIEATQFLQGGYSFLVDQSGKAIALPNQGYLDILGRAPAENETGVDLKSVTSGFSGTLNHMVNGESGFDSLLVDGRELFVAYVPLSSTGWSLGSVVAADKVLQSISTLQGELNRTSQSIVFTQALPAMLILFVLMILVSFFWTNRLVDPLQKLATATQKISAGDWEAEIPTSSNNEIGVLASNFQNMTIQLHDLIGNLEQRVADRTTDLERRSLQMQTAAQIARDITRANDLDELLTHAVNLICTRFGFYHGSLFLVEEAGEYAQLRAATGHASQEIKQRNFRLRIGQEGIVGHTIAKGSPSIVWEVDSVPEYFEDPLLSQTRSEVVFPLKVGERVMGALDLQSERPLRENIDLAEDDLTILMTLSDQLSIAIVNIQLMERLQAALKETDALYQQRIHETWALTSPEARPVAFEYDRIQVKPAEYSLEPAIIDQLKSGHAVILEGESAEQSEGRASLLVPVRLRDQVIGVIGVEEDDPQHHWSADEVAIVEAAANQAGMNLENARLYEEARSRAERERMVGDITANIRQTLDIETVLQTAAREIYQALGLHDVKIRLDPQGD